MPSTPVYMRELAPFGLIEIDDADEFAKHYLERLDRVGIDRIERRLAEISADHVGGGLVLLCYEPVGEPCHRHLFAGWYEQQTGQHVSELQESQPRLFSA